MATKSKSKAKARKPRAEKIGDDGLTNRQRKFVEEYLTCWNASEAARRAGYKNRANTAGAQTMSNNVIRSVIKKRLAEAAMSADEVLARLSDQAAASMDDFITIVKGGYGRIDFRKAKQLGKMHLLKKYAVTKEGVRIELHDVQGALTQIGRHHGLFKDVIEVEEPITIKMDR